MALVKVTLQVEPVTTVVTAAAPGADDPELPQKQTPASPDTMQQSLVTADEGELLDGEHAERTSTAGGMMVQVRMILPCLRVDVRGDRD